MKTSNSLLAAAGFAVVVGLVIWASVARETVSTESVFDGPTAEAPAEETVAAQEAEQVAQTTPSDPFERTVRVLSDEAKAISAPPQTAEDDPIAQAEQAIARADAALAEAGLPAAPASPPPPDTAHSARLDELQARLDQLPR